MNNNQQIVCPLCDKPLTDGDVHFECALREEFLAELNYPTTEF